MTLLTVSSFRPVAAKWWTIILSVAATLGFVLITFALLYDLRQTVGAKARENAENLIRAIERDIDRNLEILDLSLQAVVDGIAKPDVMSADPELRRLILFDRSGAASGLGSFVVFDTEGRITLDATSVTARQIAPVTDRDYFQAHVEADAGLFISRPYVSRLIGRPVIGLSRRLNGPGGSFGGVAVATIETAYIGRLLEQLRLGHNSFVSLVREDGALLVRQRGTERDVGGMDLSGSPSFVRMKREGTGTFVALSGIDGQERIYTFTRVGERPIYLVVALASEAVFGEWRSKAMLLATVAAVISALLIALTVRLTRELGRRDAAERTLACVNAELAELSVTDALTGIGNRRAFDAALVREVRRGARTGTPVSLLVIDVDHFKRYNDRYGHVEGDHVLQDIAGVIRAVCDHSADCAFRVGGEEFVLILPGSDLGRALLVAERLRTRLKSLARPHEASPLGIVTASVGLTEIGDEDPAAAYARADAALYRSKSAGRDRATALPRFRRAA